MKKLLSTLIVGLGLILGLSAFKIDLTIILGTGGTSTPFTPLHTYFMSPTGSDAANGLTTSTAWATPNHSVVCGDVIIAQTGAYSAFAGNFGTVSTCPSTTGGIDGSGGIYFAILLCGGSSVGGCTVTDNTGGDFMFYPHTNNWAIEGWKATSNGNASGFVVDATASGTAQVHHIAFINDITIDNANGYGTNEGALNHNVPGNGADYWAVVGSIAQNSAVNPICLAAVDSTAPSNIDNNAGTHIIFYGNFSFNNLIPGGCNSDGEAYMFDTWDAHGFTSQGIIKNNIGYHSFRYGIQTFFQDFHTSNPTIKIYNNTMYGNNFNGAGSEAEFNISGGCTAATVPWTISVTNNIGKTSAATNQDGGDLYAYATVCEGPGAFQHLTIGGVGNQNIFLGSLTSCSLNFCDSTFSAGADFAADLGTNTYVDPQFRNITDLINNHLGAPNCSGFANTTACMGYNANTQVTTSLSVIDDLTPTAGGMTGKGYQVPTTTCTADADYPTWLKGIVYLQASGFVNGATITEYSDLVTKPCGM